MPEMFIKPASISIEGVQRLALVRDPDTREPLFANGEWKPRSQFWNRRVRDGDVFISEPSGGPPMRELADFVPCESCVVPDACTASARCVKAPV